MGAANSSEVPVVQREAGKDKVKSNDDVPPSEFDVSTKDKAQLEGKDEHADDEDDDDDDDDDDNDDDDDDCSTNMYHSYHLACLSIIL
jgi:hypothetical protein